MGKYYMKRAPWGGAPSENDKGREIIEETISDELISVEADDANGLPHFAGLYDAWHFRIQGLFKAQSAQLLGEDASEVEAAKAITDYIQENFRVLPGQKRYQESTLVKIYDLCIKYAEDYAANKAWWRDIAELFTIIYRQPFICGGLSPKGEDAKREYEGGLALFIGPKRGIANGWYEWLNSWYYGDGVYYDISAIPLDSPQDFSSASLVREYAWWPDASAPGYGDRIKQWAASIVGCQPAEIKIIDS